MWVEYNEKARQMNELARKIMDTCFNRSNVLEAIDKSV